MAMNRNFLLYFALAIPILMVTITIIGVRYYHIDLKPNYNYLYAVLSNTDSYQCEQLVSQEIFPKQTSTINKSVKPICKAPIFYIYNFKNDTSTQISLEQAKKLNVSDATITPTSSDGYRMQRYCSAYRNSWWWNFSMFDTCLQKNSSYKRIVLKKYSDQENYARLVLLGWVAGTQSGNN